MPSYCDHCGLPVGTTPVEPEPDADRVENGSSRIYCCYGCRMLGETEDDATRPGDEKQQSLLIRVFTGALMAAFVMVLSLAISSEYGFEAFRTLTHDIGTAHWVLLLVAVPALALLGVPVATAALRDLRHGRLSLHVLFALGTGSAVAVSAVSYMRGTGPIYIETAVMLLALYTLGATSPHGPRTGRPPCWDVSSRCRTPPTNASSRIRERCPLTRSRLATEFESRPVKCFPPMA